MTLKFSAHKRRNIILFISLTFVVLVTVPVLFINSYLKPKLIVNLKAAVLNASDNLYQIDFGDAELHYLPSLLSLAIKFSFDCSHVKPGPLPVLKSSARRSSFCYQFIVVPPLVRLRGFFINTGDGTLDELKISWRKPRPIRTCLHVLSSRKEHLLTAKGFYKSLCLPINFTRNSSQTHLILTLLQSITRH
jgi:hypothetical protein